MPIQQLRALHLLLFLTIITTNPLQVQPRSIRITAASNLQVYTQSQLSQLCTSSCGYLSNITYPFRLSTDPTSCGDPDYQITCQNDRSPILNFHSANYLVKHISYTTQTIRLLDINLSNATCALPPRNSLSIDQLINDPRYRGHVSNTYTSFFRCSAGTNLTDQAYRKVPCLSNEEEEVYFSYGTYIISDLEGPCEFVSRVPTIYQPVLYPSYESIVGLLESGFDLGWTVECRDCVEAGGTCILSSWDTRLVYECQLQDDYVGNIIWAIFSVIWTGLLGINLIARFILAPIVIIGFLVHKYISTKKGIYKGNEKILFNHQPLALRRYSYSDIVSITNQFKDKLGKGGFGVVYKGQLPDGSLVAVKMLDNSKVNDDDFMQEVSTIRRTRHVNVIRLLGICVEGSNRALILEYMCNGSLDKYISARKVVLPLAWEKLLEIALGAARGIEHLHGGCDICILHFDIKPHNVLLDHDFVPKVSDFGLAKFCYKEKDLISIISARGTMGYIAPELILGNLEAASCKSDVYSFGMLLLEMVRGRIAEAKGKCAREVYFPSWIYEHLSNGGDLDLENATETESAITRKLCVVGLSCIQKEPSDRPLMTKVVEMLEGNVNDLRLPPNDLSFPQYSSTREPLSDSSTELLITEAGEHGF